MKEKVKPSYFDPYIYQKVLEDSWLPPFANQILEPRSVSRKQLFLFREFEERAEKYLKEQKKFIESIVMEGIYIEFERLYEYIGISDKEKHEWLEQLRKDFNLPLDYNFK